MSIVSRTRSWAWAVAAAVVIVLWVALPATRGLTVRFFRSLREPPPQTVNVNLSGFVGPDANHTLQQMVTQMISDRVTVTSSDKNQPAASLTDAGRLAGFPVRLLTARHDAPVLTVLGGHAFTMNVDRSRLQAIVKEAGRPDLVVPASIDGAVVHVTMPRTIRARYGQCPGPPSVTANVATPPPSTMQYQDCLVLTEGPRPVVQMPAGVDFPQLAQIGLEVAGMTSDQAQRFLHTVNWQATLGLPIPRAMRLYESVDINGSSGTLFNMAGRRGPTYSLVWTDRGMVFSLTGYGDSSQATQLARSVR
jgi:hypothetical protein